MALLITAGTGFVIADSLADPGWRSDRFSEYSAFFGVEESGALDSKAGGSVRALPGLGPQTRSQIPAQSRQVLIVSGADANRNTSKARLWTRTDDNRWRGGETWPAHNGLRGWSRKHMLNDLRSPVGVFTLSDAGGLSPNPGTRLPYHQSPAFTIQGTGFYGEPLAGTFDHVVAIDYNRKPGTSPLDGTKPMGPERGGGIWLHIDHGGPTHGCISVEKEHLVTLMRALDPRAHPVIVMGDRESLAR